MKLKDEYQGLIITKNLYMVGNVTLDTNVIDPIHYQNYYNIGFQEFFEPATDLSESVTANLEIVKEVKPLKLKKYKNKVNKKKDGTDPE